jgi:hypothetical protein
VTGAAPLLCWLDACTNGGAHAWVDSGFCVDGNVTAAVLDSQGHLASILVWVNTQQAEHCDVGLPQEALCLKWELTSLCSAAPVQPEVGRMKASP